MEENFSTPLLPLGERVPWERPRREWAVRLGVFLLLAMLFLPNVGAFGLWDPWETHYGEVTRNMVESYDWISPYWGYRSKIGTHSRQGNYFYSKPILIFWMEASAVRLIGFNEWAIRLPMALFGLLASFFAYYSLSKIWGRRTGLIGGFLLATCPQFFMLARQAQTDMIYVAPMTVGFLFALLALFGPWEGRVSSRSFALKVLFGIGVYLLSTIPQYVVIATDLQNDSAFESLPTFARLLALIKATGTYHAVIYGLMTLAFLAWFCGPLLVRLIRREPLSEEFKDKTLRASYILIFATMAGLASLGKGLLGFALPGAVMFVYLLVTNQWRLLRVFTIPRTILAFLTVVLPWYVAMFVKHGNAFYTRFFVHDHFNRLGTGVHQIDSGTFEHFLKWLGIGMFPWVALVPFVLILLSRLRLSVKTRDNQFKLFVFIWFFVSYLLFTLAKTKFHHYIFPALPPMALLMGKALAEHVRRPSFVARIGAILAIGLIIGVSYNLHREPQLFRNLFTYKYDRALPDHLPLDSAAPATDQAPAKCTTEADCGAHEVCQEDGLCSIDWEHTQFYAHTTDTVKWALNAPLFEYQNWVWVLSIFGVLGFLLFYFTGTRIIGLGLLLLLGMSNTFWGLNHYLPSLSPHWSQKYVFEDYYDLCGDRLEEVEEEAYAPLIKHLGMDGLYAYFQGTSKRVCPYNITSWLIVWRGETYYSYNELLPLEKKDIQLQPYLADINPAMHHLPEECAVQRKLCPRKFYVFMENRKSNTASSIASGVDGASKKIARDNAAPAQAGYQEVSKWEAREVNNENDFFTLFEVTPKYKPNPANCGCEQAQLP
jgi:4-amino-4-deoxy-L-arabinose transferase-like glycosyltransferase